MARYDVLVLGAGPAGLTAACHLTQLGRRVAVVSALKPQGARWPETIGGLQLLAHAFPRLPLGPDGGVFPSQAGVTFWRGTAEERPAGLMVDRSALDSALAGAARAAGASLFQVPPAELRLARRTGVGWQATAPGMEIESRLALDAAGRFSPWRRRTPIVSWRQVIVITRWPRAAGIPGQWLESLPQGWLFGLQGNDDAFHLFLMLEPAELRHGVSLAWQQALAHARLCKLWPGFREPAGWQVREGTPVAGVTDHASDMLPLGDAALARDPLASQGLAAALSDGLAATAAAQTLLDGGANAVVQEFWRSRQARAVFQHRRLLEAGFASVPFATDFWRRRRPPSREIRETAVPRSRQTALRQPLTLSAQWTFGESAVLAQTRIVRAKVLRPLDTLSHDPIAWLGNEPIHRFFPDVALAQTGEAWVRQWSAYPLFTRATAAQALHWLVDKGVLVPAEPGFTDKTGAPAS